jgi:hypothetical protein
MNILRLRALEKRHGPQKLTALQQRILDAANALQRANPGMTANDAIDAAADKEF